MHSILSLNYLSVFPIVFLPYPFSSLSPIPFLYSLSPSLLPFQLLCILSCPLPYPPYSPCFPSSLPFSLYLVPCPPFSPLSPFSFPLFSISFPGSPFFLHSPFSFPIAHLPFPTRTTTMLFDPYHFSFLRKRNVPIYGIAGNLHAFYFVFLSYVMLPMKFVSFLPYN